jgi:hypothetical protein
MTVIIDNIKEGEKISKCVCSTIFNKTIKACRWASCAIEWGMLRF